MLAFTRLSFAVTAVVLFLAVSLVMTTPCGAIDTLKAPPFPALSSLQALGKADYDWTLVNLDGTKVALSEFKGRVIYLRLWATWCLHCREELPSIQRLYETLKDQNVAFVVATHEDEAIIKQYVSKYQLRLPIFRYEGSIPAVFKSKRLPVTFIIDRKGGIVYEHVGAAKWDDESVVKFLGGLL